MKLPNLLRIATRRSQLALVQAEMIRTALQHCLAARNIACEIELLPMLTSGDKTTDLQLREAGGKGLFTKEIEEALLGGEAEIAMHSLKDVPAFSPPGLVLAGCLPREDCRDALVANRPLSSLDDLPQDSRVGTSSPRRAAQLRRLRPDLEIVPFRGNVPTRLEKLRNGEVDATILAVAGLKRLGLEQSISLILDAEQMLPAIGQGIVVMQCREDNAPVRELLEAITHAESWLQLQAERAILETIEGDCRSPLAGLCRIENRKLTVHGLILSEDGAKYYSCERSGSHAEALIAGKAVGNSLRAKQGEIWD